MNLHLETKLICEFRFEIYQLSTKNTKSLVYRLKVLKQK